MEIKINSLCPHELVSEDNGGGVKFNNGLDLQGLYLYEKYYPHKQEAKFNKAIAAGKPDNVSQDNWNNDVANMQSELNWMKTTPVGIVFKNAAVTQGAISEIWPGEHEDDGRNEIYTSPTNENYIDPTTGSATPGDLSYYADGHIQDVSYYSYSPIFAWLYFPDNSTISKSSYNGKKIFNKKDINEEDFLKIKLKDINAADAHRGGDPLTDKYLLCVKGNYRSDGRDFWDIGGKNMTTNKNGGLCRIYSMYGTGGVNWLVEALMNENDMYFAKMVFCFKQMVNDYNYDYTRGHTDLLSTCSDIDGDYQYGLGTPEALKKAVNDGDAVFVYRDDLLNFTKFVKEKLGVDVV